MLVHVLLQGAALALTQGARAESDPLRAVFDRIFDEALSGNSAYSKLQELCQATPHRLSGSPDAENAVSWARDQMTHDGLENVRLEPCTVPHWERGRIAVLEVVQPESARDTFLPILALGGSVATPREGIEAELCEAQSFQELAKLGDATRGKIVLFDRPMDPKTLDPFDASGAAVDQRARGAVEAARRGAVAALVRSMTLRMDDVPHTGAMRYEDGVEKIPAAAVSTAGSERLAALLRKEKRVVVRLRLDCHEGPDVPSHNVVGEILGAQKHDEIVLLGAHLDNWDVGQGAHDDGAGCAEVLEAMRLVRALGLKPARTLRAVLFMNEENGLRGARAYKEAHLAELPRHLLAIETDRGGFSPRGFETSAEGELLAALRNVSARLDKVGADLLRTGGGGADVSALRENGVAVAELLPDSARYFDVHHCTRDTLDTVHPREIELGAAALAAMAYGAADSGVSISPTRPR
jgi:Zn-dependent M28 family amino/carboxypeptidase